MHYTGFPSSARDLGEKAKASITREGNNAVHLVL